MTHPPQPHRAEPTAPGPRGREAGKPYRRPPAPAELGVSLGLWQDRAPEEALVTARLADELGFGGLWIGEMATYDACALATAVGLTTRRIGLTVGPFAVAVRDPMMVALAAASVQALTGRDTGVALGTSSAVVVRDWHGRATARGATALAESAAAVRAFLDHGRADTDGEVVRTRGYHLRLPRPRGGLTIAGFGPSALRVAARHADRLVLALVSPGAAARLADRVRTEADRAGRPHPRVAVWVPTAIGPAANLRSAVDQVRRMLVGYLAAPGYADMFAEAGHGDLVAFAATRPHPRVLLDRIPDELAYHIGVFAGPGDWATRLAEYRAAVDEVVLLPCTTDADPAGEHTLRTVAEQASAAAPLPPAEEAS
ncbi:LLM class F420-dependent oxidoreductase [Embleya sp. AB8]|uniref:LLM class F420-dependent oxidoreductase n=1 Tax=Embleya sp. AB8 TaxID=3156304 RepID=UPI003C7632F0